MTQDSTGDDLNDSEHVKLVSKQEFEDEEKQHNESEPVWLSLLDDFRFEASRLSDRIENLREDQESYIRCKALFDQDESTLQSLQQEIESKSHDISKQFNRLHSLVTELKNTVTHSRESNRLLKNVLQFECREVASLTEKYRTYQRQYLNRLNQKEKYMEQFVINFDDLDDDLESDFLPTSRLQQEQIRFSDHYNLSDSGVQFQNHQRLQMQDQSFEMLDNEFLRERDTEMANVMKSIVELNEIFQEMNSMVVNQGSLMDRIDFNIETIHMKVEESAVQLSRAERKAAQTRKLKCIFILCGSVFVALLIMILRS